MKTPLSPSTNAEDLLESRRSQTVLSTARTALCQAIVTALILSSWPLGTYAQEAQSIHLAFSPDSTILAAGGGDRSANRFAESDVFLWDVTTKQLRSKFHIQGLVADLAFSPDGREIAVGYDRRHDTKESGEVTVFDPKTGQQRFGLTVGQIFGRLAFSTKGRHLYVLAEKAGDEWVVDAWDLDGRKVVRSLPTGNSRSMVLSNEGSLLATLKGAGQVELWDVRNAGKVAAGELPVKWVASCLAYFPGDNLLAAGTVLVQEDPLKGEVRLLDGTTAQLRRSLEIPKGGVSALAFSSDGTMIAVGSIAKLLPLSSVEGELFVLDSRTGEVRHRLGKHRRPISSIAFSPHDRFLATADESGVVKLWDTRSWESAPLQVERQ